MFDEKVELRERRFSQCLFSYIFSPRRIPRERIPRERCKGVHFVDLGKSFPNSNAYLLAKFGFDTAENEPFKVR